MAAASGCAAVDKEVPEEALCSQAALVRRRDIARHSANLGSAAVGLPPAGYSRLALFKMFDATFGRTK
ncbi:hypothetical protein RPHASCH2410_PD03365 (plasmid) [Rhizobium phaseoli Ch24-10]|nr:hypothetical protein RPHASCH2410_PD03365 [Rhizobium phaseoli Ch24-10]